MMDGGGSSRDVSTTTTTTTIPIPLPEQEKDCHQHNQSSTAHTIEEENEEEEEEEEGDEEGGEQPLPSPQQLPPSLSSLPQSPSGMRKENAAGMISAMAMLALRVSLTTFIAAFTVPIYILMDDHKNPYIGTTRQFMMELSITSLAVGNFCCLHVMSLTARKAVHRLRRPLRIRPGGGKMVVRGVSFKSSSPMMMMMMMMMAGPSGDNEQ